MLAFVQLGIGLFGLNFVSMCLELLTFVVLLPEVLLLPPHFLVILFL